ncbi:F390 synthetase-related protein [Bartonella sp. HY761]|uniref:F390 synthetase-related protein n=1 Tax=Bartonella sp. HY761 TaxID=2979330 RepID=UPI0021FC41B3|nr:F390 synthetase-related protein [Bartonella sp. HY761]UXN05466.1 CoF synthetase [Bartonella sp. HY761]
MFEHLFTKRFALQSFYQVLKLKKALKTEEQLTKWQNKNLARLISKDIGKVGFYKDKNFRALEDLPIIDKKIMMDNFADFNRLEISGDELRQKLHDNDQPKNYTIGMSTGTSGNRSLYIISEREKYIWLGTILAKLLPQYPCQGAKIAVALPTATPIYQSANHLWRLQLQFFNLNDGLESVADKLAAYAPDTLIAPPHLLRFLVENGLKLPLKRVFSGAEVLDPCDRKIIDNAFGVKCQEIYMASEGLLATPCEHGNLHLCEDSMHFECEAVSDDGLVTPIITDFIRSTQIMARYRMNDVLRLDERPCPCGSPMRRISEVVGRMDDVFKLRARDGRLVTLTPDIMRNSILDASKQIEDFRLVYRKDGAIVITLPPHIDAQSLINLNLAFENLLDRFNISQTFIIEQQVLTPPPKGKLRRIINQNRHHK